MSGVSGHYSVSRCCSYMASRFGVVVPHLVAFVVSQVISCDYCSQLSRKSLSQSRSSEKQPLLYQIFTQENKAFPRWDGILRWLRVLMNHMRVHACNVLFGHYKHDPELHSVHAFNQITMTTSLNDIQQK